ncbi:MAG: enoyl-CoA hydratase/isomerase family protein [Dehalococcoidia bacterium]
MTYEQILSERRGRVALITLNRPEKLNAWTGQMNAELCDAVTMANEDDAVGAIVLTGAGRGYCAGADISAWQRSLDSEGGPNLGGNGDAPRDRSQNIVTLLRRSKPVIAAVNGPAVGIGVTHILPADIRIASEAARFGFYFVRMGAVPELASTYYLAQIVGLGAAQELCLRASMIDAQEAYRLGLVSRVVPAERLLEEALALGEEIAALPGPQLRMTKELFNRNATDMDVQADMAREGEALQKAYASPEFKEAVAAFMERRRA